MQGISKALARGKISPSNGKNPKFDAANFIELFCDGRGGRILAAPDRLFYVVESVGEARVVISLARQTVGVIDHASNMTESDVGHFLEDQVRPRLRSHLGEFVLHAGLVRIENGTLVIAGPSGHGKSTLSAGLDRLGWPILGDDATVISITASGVRAVAANRRLSLFPQSLSLLGWSRPGSDAANKFKERVDLPPLPGADEPASVLGIIVLAPPDDTDTITLRLMSPAEGCMALVANSFSLDPTDAARALVRLQQASEIAKSVDIHELRYPRLHTQIPDVQAAILGLIKQTTQTLAGNG